MCCLNEVVVICIRSLTDLQLVCVGVSNVISTSICVPSLGCRHPSRKWYQPKAPPHVIHLSPQKRQHLVATMIRREERRASSCVETHETRGTCRLHCRIWPAYEGEYDWAVIGHWDQRCSQHCNCLLLLAKPEAHFQISRSGNKLRDQSLAITPCDLSDQEPQNAADIFIRCRAQTHMLPNSCCTWKGGASEDQTACITRNPWSTSSPITTGCSRRRCTSGTVPGTPRSRGFSHTKLVTTPCFGCRRTQRECPGNLEAGGLRVLRRRLVSRGL